MLSGSDARSSRLPRDGETDRNHEKLSIAHRFVHKRVSHYFSTHGIRGQTLHTAAAPMIQPPS